MTIRKRNKINAVKTSKNLNTATKRGCPDFGQPLFVYKGIYLKRFLLQRFTICIQFDDLIAQFL
jgi:hypothetical protein